MTTAQEVVNPADVEEVLSTAPTEPAAAPPKQSRSSPGEPIGNPYPLKFASLMPGESTQMFTKLASAGTIRGIQVTGGAQIRQVIAGKFNLDLTKGDWPKGGLQVPAGTFVTAVVENLTKETIASEGVVYVEDGAQIAQPAPALTGKPGPVPPPVASAVAPAGPQGPITPGVNEVAILMRYGDAQRLLEVARGTGSTLADGERPPLVRAIEDALARMR